MKTCSRCRKSKPLDAFGKCSSYRDGRLRYCRDCMSAYNKERRQNTEYLAREREWGRNQDALRRTDPNRKAIHLKHSRAWSKKHPEYNCIRVAAYMARKRHSSTTGLTVTEWQQIKDAYGHKCAYCGKAGKPLTMDHVVPIAHGGAHTAANIVPACKSCNSAKGARPAPPFQRHLWMSDSNLPSAPGGTFLSSTQSPLGSSLARRHHA